MIVNKLYWVSSPQGPKEELKELDRQMSAFYAGFEQRQAYQKLNDDMHDAEASPNNKLADEVASYIVSRGFERVLEVGCGSGKTYAHLLAHGFGRSYKGIEMAEYVIRANRSTYPAAEWEAGSVYGLEREPGKYDCCFCFYVLEHLIYPDKGLAAMLHTVRPGGELVLLFPDFCCSGIVPSQKIGLRYGAGASEKLKRGRVLDAFISFWEARMMRKELGRLNERYGDFVINYRPFCLDKECQGLIPDIDAIYLANKKEVERWAIRQGCTVSYPLGTEGLLAKNAFMAIKKK